MNTRLPDIQRCHKKYIKKKDKSISYNEENIISESDISKMVNEAIQKIFESVFIDKNKINTKNKSVGLTYKKGRASNPLTYFDMLGTDLMDNTSTNDTYEVKLKGGITSYNITSIRGEQVMHFFKNFKNSQKSKIKVKTGSSTEDYDIIMQSEELMNFIQTFIQKVWTVIKYNIIKKGIKHFEKISIYPIPSSSNFNEEMSKILSHMSILGIPVQTINQDMLVKDLRNLEIDSEFYEKNKDYYNGKLFTDKDFTITDSLNSSINRYNVVNKLKKYIDEYNKAIDSILENFHLYNETKSDLNLSNIAFFYKKAYDLWEKCKKDAIYDDPTSENGIHKISKSKIADEIDSSENQNSEEIWELIKDEVENEKSPITGKKYKKIKIVELSPSKFQIKKLADPVRMGLRNIYNPNKDEKLVKKEVEKTKNSVFVIFDDNISGGSTLSDVCYQCKNLGIKNIIPITFGKMSKKITLGQKPIIMPKDDYNY